MIVVVLGMHRSGTSLVSSILHTMGVKMGEPADLKRFSRRSQPRGYWEDQDFLSLNEQIMGEAGGNWYMPPPSGDIVKAAEAHREEMAQLIERKETSVAQENLAAEALHGAPAWIGWGWKDPRNAVTIGAWWPFVRTYDLRIVRTRRLTEGIVDSLMRRETVIGQKRRFNLPLGAGDKEHRIAWARVADYHWRCTVGFLEATDPRLERCADVRYEDLVHKDTAIIPLNCLARLLGLEGDAYVQAMKAGMDRIEFRG